MFFENWFPYIFQIIVDLGLVTLKGISTAQYALLTYLGLCCGQSQLLQFHSLREAVIWGRSQF